jgi:hypothetical protein
LPSWVILQVEMTKKAYPVEKTQCGSRIAFTDEQIAHFKAKLLELIRQGWTLRQILLSRASAA